MNKKATQPAVQKTREIQAADLPLCCPRPNDSLWNAHPRVYLPIEKTGTAVCPYCDAEYHLVSS